MLPHVNTPGVSLRYHFLSAPAHCTAGKFGKPITYGAMRGLMEVLLPMCGMAVEDAGCHSFRRGTATGLAHINAPSYIVKGIGIWGSDAYLGYVDATEPSAIEQAMLSMAEADPSGVLGPRGIARR